MKEKAEEPRRFNYAISGFAVLLITVVVIHMLVEWTYECRISLNYLFFEPAVLFAVPLFFLVLVFAVRGKFWAYVIWLGFLFYFLYLSYISSHFHIYKYTKPLFYTSFFLILYTFVVELKSINPSVIAERLSDKIPRKTTVAFFVLGIITIIGPIILSVYFQIYHAEDYFESHNIMLYYYERLITAVYFTMLPHYLHTKPVVDLGFLLPLYGIITYQLIRKKDWGYILAPIVFIKSAISIFSLLFYNLLKIHLNLLFCDLHSTFMLIIMYGFGVIGERGFGYHMAVIWVKIILFVLFTLTAAGLTIFFLIKLWKSRSM